MRKGTPAKQARREKALKGLLRKRDSRITQLESCLNRISVRKGVANDSEGTEIMILKFDLNRIQSEIAALESCGIKG